MSVLSLLTSVILAGMVYGLSFLPTATLTRPDDDVELGLMDDGLAGDETGDTDSAPGSHA